MHATLSQQEANIRPRAQFLPVSFFIFLQNLPHKCRILFRDSPAFFGRPVVDTLLRQRPRALSFRHSTYTAWLQMSEEEVCWICLDGPGEDGLVQVSGVRKASSQAPVAPRKRLTGNEPSSQACNCPRLVHRRCLARWQLQSAGTDRERLCQFCQATLPDWRPALTPLPLSSSSPAVMSVNFNGRAFSFAVRPGPSGYEDFTLAIRRAFNLPSESDLNITFTCDEPFTGSLMTLHGAGAYDAAVHCACVSAEKRNSVSCTPRHHPHLFSDSPAPSEDSRLERPHAASVADPRSTDGWAPDAPEGPRTTDPWDPYSARRSDPASRPADLPGLLPPAGGRDLDRIDPPGVLPALRSYCARSAAVPVRNASEGSLFVVRERSLRSGVSVSGGGPERAERAERERSAVGGRTTRGIGLMRHGETEEGEGEGEGASGHRVMESVCSGECCEGTEEGGGGGEHGWQRV